MKKEGPRRARQDTDADGLIFVRAFQVLEGQSLRQIVENAGEDAAVILNAVKAGMGGMDM